MRDCTELFSSRLLVNEMTHIVDVCLVSRTHIGPLLLKRYNMSICDSIARRAELLMPGLRGSENLLT